jgi:hypothetical protein
MLKFFEKEKPFSKIFFLTKDNKSDGIFGNISFVEMESSKLVN